MAKIGIVIVTYNRINKLIKTLGLFEQQSLAPQYILVVNNNSTDGTCDFLSKWETACARYNKYVINLPRNIGGSGGFKAGLDKSLELDADWVWVSDDDAYPYENTIERAHEYIEHGNMDNVVALCAAVYDSVNESISIGHRKNVYHSFLSTHIDVIPEEQYKREFFKLNAFSYVGAIINKDVLQRIGTTKEDYFIRFDDTEHSLRICKCGRVICVPEIKVKHDNGVDLYDWREFYGLRNEMDMYKMYMPYRCYVFKVLKRKLKLIKLFFGNDKEYYELYKKALHDGTKGILGKDSYYLPSWKPQKKENKI